MVGMVDDDRAGDPVDVYGLPAVLPCGNDPRENGTQEDDREDNGVGMRYFLEHGTRNKDGYMYKDIKSR